MLESHNWLQSPCDLMAAYLLSSCLTVVIACCSQDLVKTLNFLCCFYVLKMYFSFSINHQI